MSNSGLGSVSAVAPAATDTTVKGSYSQGAWFTYDQKGYYGHEITYLTTRFSVSTILRQAGVTATTTAEDRRAVDMAAYNFLIYFMPRGERWRPYMTGGAQAYDYQRPYIDNWPSGYTKHFGMNFGGGIKLQLFPHALARLDVHDYIGGKPWKMDTQTGGFLHQLEATAGFGINF
jgi:hypothetical protein